MKIVTKQIPEEFIYTVEITYYELKLIKEAILRNIGFWHGNNEVEKIVEEIDKLNK
jgi:hypothetical protein